MHKSFFSVLLISFLFFVLCLLPAKAQERKGAITGNVTDSSGGVLKSAQVSIESQNVNIPCDSRIAFAEGAPRRAGERN